MLKLVYLLCSYYLWSISKPGKNGTPTLDLSKECELLSSSKFTHTQLAYERVIKTIFKHYAIPLEVSDTIRSAFRAKLWRMGKLFSKQGSKKRKEQLSLWKDGKDAIWNFTVGEVEVNRQLLKRKHAINTVLQEECTKRRKLETEVKILKKTTKSQATVIARLKTGRLESCRGSSSKSWYEYSRQQRHNKKKNLAGGIQGALSFCQDEGFKACEVRLKNVDTGNCEMLDIDNLTFSKDAQENTDPVNHVSSALYIKDKFSISNQAFHELSIISNLPTSTEIKKQTKVLNSQFEIRNAPNGIIGVQQSLQTRLQVRISALIRNLPVESIPQTIRVKLTGDGTQIARGLSVINFGFTVLEEGMEAACSASGNHTLAILKTSEKYEDLKAGLQEICTEAKNLKVITVDGRKFNVEYFLGGDMKFLASVCGIEAATCEHSCVWCKCPKSKRWNMDTTWSLTDSTNGARTIEEIAEKSKFAKTSKYRFNCCHPPLFDFIPIQRVVVDSLHLFLRIADVLINLLIRDLRILDGVEKRITKESNMEVYRNFLNEQCKIRFQWFVNKDSKSLNWRDLTGPEKIRLFNNATITSLFPSMKKKEKIQQLWTDFFQLINDLSKLNCDADQFGFKAKAWVRLFISIYQTKDVTPYMHIFAMHVPEFLHMYGNIVMFTQQGLEKLNDTTTQHFQRASNHRDHESLKQLLEKRNRLESLKDSGYQRKKQVQRCSQCKQTGHNKRSCPLIPTNQVT